MTHLDLSGNQLKELKAKDIKPTSRLLVLDVTNNKIEKIERQLFLGITKLTFRAKGNVCTNDNYEIKDDFASRVAPLLEKCLNFGITTQSNIILLIAAAVVSFTAKIM